MAACARHGAVRLSYGYQIEGTPNHRVQVLAADGSIQFVRLDELKVGDTAVLYSNQQVFGPGAQPLPGYCQERLTNSKDISFPEVMSSELAYILGCITSEGSLSRNGVYITNGDRGLLERLGELFWQIFGLSSHICKDMRRESVYTLQVNSRHLRNWLLADWAWRPGHAIRSSRAASCGQARPKSSPSCVGCSSTAT